MDNIFILAEKALYASDIDSKLDLTRQTHQLAQQNRLSFDSKTAVNPAQSVTFPENPRLLPPRKMPKRSLNTDEGRAAFFHALAHIEFIAIYLAWDIIYRFRDLPEQFYLDWLTIADEEAQHFQLLRQHLKLFGVDYGDLPAHRGLWEHAVDTREDILARLAIVPRCMEARGLDVTPAMIDKFKKLNDDASVSVLTRILNDEIGHVKTGSYWFKYFCRQQGFDSEQMYCQLIEKYYKGKPKGPFNREMRIIAGFSSDEIDWLEQRSHE